MKSKARLPILGAVCLSLALAACNSVNGSVNPGSGQLQNWPSGQTGTFQIYLDLGPRKPLFSTTPINGAGKFSYTLGEPDPSALDNLSTDCRGGTGGYTQTPSDAKVTFAIAAAVLGSGSTPTGSVLLSSGPLSLNSSIWKLGDQVAQWIYMTQDSKFVGTCTANGLTTVMSVNFKKGWNFAISTVKKVDANGKPTEIENTATTSGLPTNIKWIYQPFTAVEPSGFLKR